MGMIAGELLNIAGTALAGSEADAKRAEWQTFMRQLKEPDVNQYEGQYFKDLQQYAPAAAASATTLNKASFNEAMRQREQALPGYQAAIQGALPTILGLVQGNLPSGLMSNFQRAGGASTVGMGMGGSGFGALNTGLFGARGALGAMQQGYGLLGQLLNTMPNVPMVTATSMLQNGIMDPTGRTNLAMQLRQQQIGMEGKLMGMPTAGDMWSAGLIKAGSRWSSMGMGDMGGGGGGMFGGGGGGGGGAPLGQWNNYGATYTPTDYPQG